MSKSGLTRIPPFHYIHVLDQNSTVVRLETGPSTFVPKDHEQIILDPKQMIRIPPHHYCVIENPAILSEKDRKPLVDGAGQVRLRHADQEVRFSQDPFPLYPGEVLVGTVKPLVVVKANTALRLQASRDVEIDGITRIAGDEWHFEGPGTYTPNVAVKILKEVASILILPGKALRLRAKVNTVSRDGKKRVVGEEWIVSEIGAYLPGVDEEVIDHLDGIVLTDKVAVHLQALSTFTDAYGTKRRNGEEWLVTSELSACHIPSVEERVVGLVHITTLSSRQYVVILNPIGKDGKPSLGQKKVVKGEKSFFLQPGESIQSGIQDIHILGEEDGLVLRAREAFEDSDGDLVIKRKPGEKWMIVGPREYSPPVQVEVIQTRKLIPLDEHEGVYVRDMSTGHVRAVIGHSYMLKENEEFWEKELPAEVENLLFQDASVDRFAWKRGGPGASSTKPERKKHSVVSYRVPHNAAVQIYDYEKKKARVEFGPDMVLLQPNEQFTLLSISGGQPKQPNQIRSICLLLGPNFCSDVFVVETGDHARLSLTLAYSWYFEIDRSSEEDRKKIFTVPDVIGDLCQTVASRVRATVAGTAFDDFHKNSARIIRASVLGLDENGKVHSKLVFPKNKLAITAIDIQSIEPVDKRTQDALQKSVQLAIEITTDSQEASAKFEAQRVEQEAKGRLERQRITDETQAEKARKQLLELQALSAAVESTGQAKAEASARTEAQQIEGEAAVKQAELRVQAAEIESSSELERRKQLQKAELQYQREQNAIEIHKAKEMADLEAERLEKTVSAIKRETLVAISRAGPEMQMKLLQSLGIKSTLITDGKSPINLFNTAKGLISTSNPQN